MCNDVPKGSLENHVHPNGVAHSHEGFHSHVHPDGTVHNHDDNVSHVHPDGTCHCHEGFDVPHVHTNKKAVLDRLAKAKGHLESVMTMIDNDRDCAEVLVQIAAVRSAINNAGKVLLQDHISECVTHAVYHNDQTKIEELNRAIERFIK